MAINRIELAIEADDVMEEGLEALAAILETLGLDVKNDVQVVVTPTTTGEPVLVAVLQVGITGDDSDRDA